MTLANRLHKMPAEIWAMPTDQFFTAVQFFTFLREYEDAEFELNKDDKK